MSRFYNAHCWLQTPIGNKRSPHGFRLRISTAHHEWNHNIQALVALEKGYLKEEGLEDLEFIAFTDNEAAQIEALAGGSVDIALDGMIQRVLSAQDQGADIYIVAPRRKIHSFVVFGQKWMKSIQDLKGRTLHVAPEGEATQQLKEIVKFAGLEWGKDVSVEEKPDTGMHDLAGFRKSFLDEKTLTVNIHPWEVEEWKSKGYPVLADTTKLFPPRQDRVVTAGGRIVNEESGILKAFLKAYIKASRFIVNPENMEEIRTIAQKGGFLQTEVDQKNFSKILESLWHRISPDGALPVEGVEQAIKEERQAGNISDRVQISKILKLEALEQARRELGISS